MGRLLLFLYSPFSLQPYSDFRFPACILVSLNYYVETYSYAEWCFLFVVPVIFVCVVYVHCSSALKQPGSMTNVVSLYVCRLMSLYVGSTGSYCQSPAYRTMATVTVFIREHWTCSNGRVYATRLALALRIHLSGDELFSQYLVRSRIWYIPQCLTNNDPIRDEMEFRMPRWYVWPS